VLGKNLKKEICLISPYARSITPVINSIKSRQYNSQTMQTAALSLECLDHKWLQMLERYDSSLRANHPLDTTVKKHQCDNKCCLSKKQKRNCCVLLESNISPFTWAC